MFPFYPNTEIISANVFGTENKKYIKSDISNKIVHSTYFSPQEIVYTDKFNI